MKESADRTRFVVGADMELIGWFSLVSGYRGWVLIGRIVLNGQDPRVRVLSPSPFPRRVVCSPSLGFSFNTSLLSLLSLSFPYLHEDTNKNSPISQLTDQSTQKAWCGTREIQTSSPSTLVNQSHHHPGDAYTTTLVAGSHRHGQHRSRPKPAQPILINQYPGSTPITHPALISHEINRQETRPSNGRCSRDRRI
jgi:hypothetical protein